MPINRLRLFAALVCLLFPALAMNAQQNWRWLNPSPGGAYNAVAYGNGLYVAVGADGLIATSSDAATWTIRRQAIASQVLNDVTFADGRFVAVGQDALATSGSAALILTSTDGLTWTQGTFSAAFNSQLFTILHNGTIWLAAGLSSPNAYATSTDGLSWTARGVNTGDSLIRGAVGGGRFVFTNDQNRVNTSTDGVTWTRSYVVGSADNFNFSFGEVAYFNGAFYVAGRNDSFAACVYTSTTGATWTPAAATIASSSGGATFMTQGAGLLVIAGGSGLFTSPDGTTWTKRTSGQPDSGASADTLRAVGAANGLLFSFGTQGGITTSTDGITWTRRGAGTVQHLGGLVHDGTRFVATGERGTVLTSTDGTTWTAVASGRSNAFGSLAYGAGRYATTGAEGLYHSANLTGWTQPSNSSFQMFGVIFANNRFIAANNALALGIRTSTDGSTWSSVTVSATAGREVKGLAGGGGHFVITTSGFSVTPKIFESADGLTWTDRTPEGFTEAPGSLAYGNGRFVLLTSYKVWTSTDGVTWTSAALPSASYVTSVMFVGDKFIARPYAYTSYRTSTDGVTWTTVANSDGPNQIAAAMVENGGWIYAVGASGMIVRGSVASAQPGRIANVSIRGAVGLGDEALIVGTVVGGSAQKPVLFRAAGPSLAPYGVTDHLADPHLRLVVQATGATIGENDNWAGNSTLSSVMTQVGAFAFTGSTSKDAAHYTPTLAAGPYSIVVTGADGGTGSTVAEVYDAEPSATFTSASPRLVNISGRGRAGGASNPLIAGFVIDGTTAVRVLVRGIGPTLGSYGVAGTLVDPEIRLYRTGEINALSANDNWESAQGTEIAAEAARLGAFALASGSKDAAFLLTLQPGVYTVHLSGVGDTSGIGLIEVYEAGL